MSEKWTSGYWERNKTLVYALHYRDDGLEENRFFAGIQGPHCPAEELEANAALMVAAPNMAKFIDKLANMEILFFEGRDEDIDTLIEIKREAAELMALARGE